MIKKFLNEFKEFAMRGNVIDLAVGVIIGGAFSGIVQAVIDNIIQPILNLVVPKMESGDPNTAVACIMNLLGAIINFVVTALVLFLIIKAVNAAKTIGKKKEEAAPATKICPYCQSEISIKATRCPHCTSELK